MTVLQVDSRVADVIFIEFSKAFKDFSIILLYSRWHATVEMGKTQVVCSLDRGLGLEDESSLPGVWQQGKYQHSQHRT